MEPTATATPGVLNLGLMKFRSNAALEVEAQDKSRMLASSMEPSTPQIPELSGYILKCWEAAKQAKIPIEQQMLQNLRQRHGVYEADKLAAIRQMGGSEVYVLLTATKCRAAEAWIMDILTPIMDRPWTINPTPLPRLPEDLEGEIRANVQAVFREVIAQAQQAAEMLDPAELREEIRLYTESERDKAMEAVKTEADLRAERMALRIDDQLKEGGWDSCFWGVVSDLVTLKAGILKGPVIRRTKTKKWVQGVGGKWELATTEELVPHFDRVSPLDLYPAPDSRSPDDGFLFERHFLTRSDLISMIGVPGYNEENIRAVLRNYSAGRREWLASDSERAQLEFGTTFSLTSSDKIEALEFWGSVPGQMLLDWGIGVTGIDPEMDYEINAWQVGGYTIRAILNPDKLGKKPYSVDSFERVAGSFWGRGVPELMSDVQDVCNAVARAIVNNTSMASGPQVEVNIERVDSDSEDLWPWKIWQSTNQQMSEQPAVRFYQPNIVTGPLIQVFEFFSALSEDQTGIPRWAYGNTALGGASATSSGLSMLMTSASRGIKAVISHVDALVSSCISRVYDYNMLFDPDEGLKGDAVIVPRGSASLLAKEQKVVRRTEFLAATNNPIDVQLLGLKNRARLLMEQAKELDMKVDSDSELEQQIQMVAKQLQAKAAAEAQMGAKPTTGAAPQAAPQTLDNAGQPAGGTNVDTFQNQEGVTPGAM